MSASIVQCLQLFQKITSERQFFFIYRLQRMRFQVQKCFMQSINSRQIRCPGFKAIRHKIRNFFRMRYTSGTAGNQWFHLFCQFLGNQETTCPLWSPKSFMSGKS